MGVTCFLGSLYLIYHQMKALIELTRDMSWTESLTGMEVFFACLNTVPISMAYFTKALGLWMTIFALGRWSGDPATKLLVAIARRESSEGGG